MNRIVLDLHWLVIGQRVYVKDLDVFGRYNPTDHTIVCEAPMTGYVYKITEKSVLYDESIGDREAQ